MRRAAFIQQRRNRSDEADRRKIRRAPDDWPRSSRETAAQPRSRQSEPAADSEGITIFELQERLSGLGYKLGEVDGVNGPRTIDALKRFQSDNKLPVTGAIDAETVRRLRAKP